MLSAVETFLIMLSFKYPPIPAAFDIRLTKLKPYSAGHPVRCELVNPSFADKRYTKHYPMPGESLRMASSRSTLTSIHFKLASIYTRLS
jgi:hypothetical protein